jgi:CheY-like chemotaxis protein
MNQIVTLRAVNSLGFTAEVVAGSDQARRAIDRTRFAAVLLHCRRPGPDGYQAIAQIRQREAQGDSQQPTPIIAMTASATEGAPDRCRAAGRDDYLAKPIRMAALSAALERWTRGPEATKLTPVPPILLEHRPHLEIYPAVVYPFRFPKHPLGAEA